MAWGIKNIFSIGRRVPLPAGVHTKAEMKIWLSPTQPEWHRIPDNVDGPFRLIRTAHPGEAIYAWSTHDDLGAAIVEFVECHLPRRDEVCMIIDERHCQILLGWVFKNGGFQWAGCAYTFGLLAFYHDPVEAGIWEIQAYEARQLLLKEQVFNG